MRIVQRNTASSGWMISLTLTRLFLLWFIKERTAGTSVSGPALMEKAAVLYRKMHLEDKIRETLKGEGLAEAFSRTCHVCIHWTHKGSLCQLIYPLLGHFKEQFLKIVADEGLTRDQVRIFSKA